MFALLILWQIGKNSLGTYEKIFGDNFFWVGTAGTKLLLGPGPGKKDVLVLAECIPMCMFDEERLYERMEDLVNAVESWNTQYPKLQQEGGSSSSASTSSSDNIGIFPATDK
jgi:hypothetical protein